MSIIKYKISGKERRKMKQKLRHMEYLNSKYENDEVKQLQIEDYKRALKETIK